MDITKSYLIKASVSDVWRALTDTATMEQWGAGPAEMCSEAGCAFSLWDGDIHGTIVEAVEDERLVEEWYGGDWDEPSIATFTLSRENGSTRLDLVHERVPDDEAADFDAGWDEHYFRPMKALLEH